MTGRTQTPLLGHGFARTPFGVHAVAAAAQRASESELSHASRASRTDVDRFRLDPCGVRLRLRQSWKDGLRVDGGEQT
jgi:hypothetical protein